MFRKMWTERWILGVFNNLVQELELEDNVCYMQYFRMNPQLFKALVEFFKRPTSTRKVLL
jgi:hypothetical protein